MLRSLFLAAAAGLALTVGVAPVGAAPVSVSGAKPTANVKVLKPLSLVALRNLDFGTIIMGSLTGAETVSVTAAGRVCGAGNLTCSGSFATARFQVNGSNNQLVLVRSAAPTYVLTGSNGGSLVLTPVLPPSVTLDNSGNPGAQFEVGGRFTVSPTTPDGFYTGTIDIQVAYQ